MSKWKETGNAVQGDIADDCKVPRAGDHRGKARLNRGIRGLWFADIYSPLRRYEGFAPSSGFWTLKRSLASHIAISKAPNYPQSCQLTYLSSTQHESRHMVGALEIVK